MNLDAKIKLSLVIPVYNEESVLPLLTARLWEVLEKLADTAAGELIFVNDGSTDRSLELLKKQMQDNPRFIVVNLSRNFGHTEAISAGLSVASGDVVVVMDADLQDPPELIPEMLKAYKQGFQVVLAERRSRQEKGVRRLAFDLFYRAFDFLADFPMTEKAGVFSLMDRTVVDHLNRLPEHNRFLPGLRNWVGFRKTSVLYDRSDRVAGKPKQTLKRLLQYGMNAVFSFSYKPLRLSFYLGLIVSFLFFMYALVLIVNRIFNIDFVKGFTTPTVTIMFLGGVQLIAIGILGEYLARIYDEVKHRPSFIISDVWSSSEKTVKAKAARDQA